MDIHTRIVAVLHIVLGVLGGAAAFMRDTQLPGFVVGLGAMFLGFFVLLALVDVIAGVALLNGSRGARIFIIVISALGLFSFPFGTLIGAYSLWALLRKQPVLDAA